MSVLLMVLGMELWDCSGHGFQGMGSKQVRGVWQLGGGMDWGQAGPSLGPGKEDPAYPLRLQIGKQGMLAFEPHREASQRLHNPSILKPRSLGSRDCM